MQQGPVTLKEAITVRPVYKDHQKGTCKIGLYGRLLLYTGSNNMKNKLAIGINLTGL